MEVRVLSTAPRFWEVNFGYVSPESFSGDFFFGPLVSRCGGNVRTQSPHKATEEREKITQRRGDRRGSRRCCGEVEGARKRELATASWVERLGRRLAACSPGATWPAVSSAWGVLLAAA